MRPGPKSVARDAISWVAWHQWSVGREEPGRKVADRAVVPRAGCTCPLRSAPWAVALLATGLSACRSPPRSEREGTCACCRLPDLRVIPVWAPQPPNAPSHLPPHLLPPTHPPKHQIPPWQQLNPVALFNTLAAQLPCAPGEGPQVSALSVPHARIPSVLGKPGRLSPPHPRGASTSEQARPLRCLLSASDPRPPPPALGAASWPHETAE